ncbi:MAG TPA: hypothetical protein VL948_22605 [Verrucomicrobiae bacterium]|nr:hypothetical protein [Verrucomicrobiae bacterium]
MTMEEVLIVLLAVASALSLFVGLAQALDDRPRRIPLRRRAHALSPHRRPATAEPTVSSKPRGGRIFSDAAPATALRTAVVAELEPVIAPELVAPPGAPEAPSPTAADVGPVAHEVEPTVARPVSEQISLLETESAGAPEPLAVEAERMAPAHAAAEADAAAPAAVEPDVAARAALTEPAADLVGEAARLFKAGQYEGLLAALEPALKVRGRARNRVPASFERALLSGMAGLAQRARGDEAATRAAFEQGVRALPKTDVNGSAQRVMPLAESIGSRLLTDGEAAGDGTAATLAALRLAVGLLRQVAVAQGSQPSAEPAVELPSLDVVAVDAGGDELPPWGKALRAHLAVERARDALATAAGHRLDGFLGKRDHSAGHRWLREVMGWDELGDRRAPMEDTYWEAVSGEVARLAGSAVETSDDAAGALAALERADGVIASLPSESAESPRFDELRRRIWWGHVKLGLRRLEVGDPAGALDPLYRALHRAGGDGDREMETRHALAQALDAQAAGASARIEHLLEAGDRAGAEMVGEELCRAIDRGLAEGVSQEELVDALAKRQNVMARIAQAV